MVDRNVSLVPIVAKTVSKVAKRSHSLHRGYVELDDLIQEGWLWVAEHEAQVWERIDSEDTDKSVESWLYSRLRTHIHRYTIKQRTLVDGTKPGDYYLYPVAVIEALLPDLFDEPDTRGNTDLNQDRGRRAPNEGFEYEAMIADLRSGFESLNDDERVFLMQRYASGGVSTEVLAIQHEVTQRAIQQRLNRTIKKIARHLGGEPIERSYRQPMSNAQAGVTTRRAEVGD